MTKLFSIAPQPWTKYAECTDPSVNPDWFFPEAKTADAYEIATALRICASCRVKNQCLNYAIETYPNDGIWGGVRPSQLKKLAEMRIQ